MIIETNRKPNVLWEFWKVAVHCTACLNIISCGVGSGTKSSLSEFRSLPLITLCGRGTGIYEEAWWRELSGGFDQLMTAEVGELTKFISDAVASSSPTWSDRSQSLLIFRWPTRPRAVPRFNYSCTATANRAHLQRFAKDHRRHGVEGEGATGKNHDRWRGKLAPGPESPLVALRLLLLTLSIVTPGKV